MNKNSAQESRRICILACVFWPLYPGYGGAQAFVIAQTLAQAGYEVNVVTTFPINPKGKRSLRYALIAKERWNDIKVIRVPALRPTSPGLGRKLWFYLSFALTSLIALPFIQKADVILGLDPPAPFLLLPGFLFSRLLRAKYIVRVTDLWPDVVFDFDIAKSRPARKAATLVTTVAYRLADHIMAFTPRIKPGIMKYGIPDEKITVVEIAIDTSLFRPIPDVRNQSASLGLPNPDTKFIVLYSGAFALTYDFATLLEAAIVKKPYSLGYGGENYEVLRSTAIGNIFSDGTIPIEKYCSVYYLRPP